MIPYIDLHCDTLMQAFLAKKADIFDFPNAMVDLRRLAAAGCRAQFFAIFMPPMSYRAKLGAVVPSDDEYIKALCEIFSSSIRAHADLAAEARSAGQMQANAAQGKISAFLTVEDGRAVNGKLEKLSEWHQKGIRLVSLTWNEANCFGSPNADDALVMQTGLTAFGKEAVSFMNELGMLVDVSHLSDAGFWDVARQSKKPFVASHSNCRALAPHRRNLTDEMICCLGEKGGVAGLNFGPEFLNQDVADRQSTIERMAAHARHMADRGGVGCVAIGSDFDGVQGEMEIGGAEKMQNLFDGLRRAGFAPSEIDAIAYKNASRVIEQVL